MDTLKSYIDVYTEVNQLILMDDGQESHMLLISKVCIYII